MTTTNRLLKMHDFSKQLAITNHEFSYELNPLMVMNMEFINILKIHIVWRTEVCFIC
jgi:hypothetical protein